MTCAHVLRLIDAQALVDVLPADRAEAWQHATGCAACRAAWATAESLTERLAALPSAAPPRDLAGLVMARAARIDEPQNETDAARAGAGASHGTRWPIWTTACGGAIAALCMGMSGVDHWSLWRLSLADQLSSGTVATLSGAGMVALAAGLALYVAGLFAPIAPRLRR
jgi:hypothetical protein